MRLNDFPFLEGNDSLFFKNLLKLWFVLYKIPLFHSTSFIVDNEGWYCVTNGNISFPSLLFCFRSLDSLFVNFISDSRFFIKVCG